MRIKKAYLLVLVVFLWNCSSDDAPRQEDIVSNVPDFVVLGEDLNSLYLYDYDASEEDATSVNLTLEDNLGIDLLTVNQIGEVVTFYSFALGSFSALQRNVTTGEARVLPSFYTLEGNRSVIWGTNSENHFFVGYFSPIESGDYGMRSIDIATGVTKDILLEEDVTNVYDPIYHNGKLFLTYRIAGVGYKIAVLDADTSEILHRWEFSAEIPSIYIEAAGDIAIITRTDGNQYTNTIYDFDTYESREEMDFSVNRFFSPGPLKAFLINNKLYYLFFYAQPSAVTYSPAVFDFSADQNTILDMAGIVRELENAKGVTISLTVFSYEPEEKSFLVGYTKDFNKGEFEGGIMVISEAGELLRDIEIPFVPIFFFKS
jgi:hypothetical protein